MKKDPADSTRPLVSRRACCLGVRTSGAHADIDVDESSCVLANRKGMSVSADWRTLMPHLIPEELDDGVIGARGRGMEVFVHGPRTGLFAQGFVGPGLELHYKSAGEADGVVCPTVTVPLTQYEADLASTRPDWVIDPS